MTEYRTFDMTEYRVAGEAFRQVGFSTRLTNSLRRNGIYTVAELAQFSDAELLACRWIGVKQLADLRAVVPTPTNAQILAHQTRAVLEVSLAATEEQYARHQALIDSLQPTQENQHDPY